MAHLPGARYLCEWPAEQPLPDIDEAHLLPDEWAGGVRIDHDCPDCCRRVAVLATVNPSREYISVEGRWPYRRRILGELAEEVA